MRKVSSLIFSLLLFGCLNLSAQKETITGNRLGASAFYGALIPHNDVVQGLAANIHGAELRCEWVGTIRPWQKDYRYPATGLVMQVQNNGNAEKLGLSVGIGGYISFPVFRFWRTEMHLRTTAGVGFVSKHFDMKNNPSNLAIGSHLNIFAGLHGIWKIPLNEDLLLNLGAGGSHFSNGDTRMPNLGINCLQLMAGFDYILAPERKILPHRDKIFEKERSWEVMFMMAFRQTDLVWMHNTVVPSLRFRRSGNVSPRSRITGGIDFSLDKIYYFSENRSSSGKDVPMAQKLEVGLTFGHHLLIGKFGLMTELGVYLYQPNDFKDRFFQRVGGRYDYSRRHYFWLAIKSHYFNADYIEFGLGTKIFGKARR